MRHEGGWTRRSVLTAFSGGTVLAGAAGCDWWEARTPPDPPDPLEPLRSATIALGDRYRSTIAVHPELADRLQPLLAAHEAHAAALRDLIGGPPSATAAPTAAAPPPAVPPDTDQALAVLRDAEHDGRDQAAAACVTAPAERAALLGSICAARATHLEVLA